MRSAALLILLCGPLGCGKVPFQPVVASDDVSSGKVLHIGGAVRPPVLVHQVDVEMTDEAKATHKGIDAQIYLWVEADGTPSHIRIVRSANMGGEMDQCLLDAVSQSRYKPATLNGVPVAVDLYTNISIDVL